MNQVTCECGFQTRDAQEGPVVTAVLDHVRSDHPDLQGSVTPEVVRGWIEIVPDEGAPRRPRLAPPEEFGPW